MREEVMEITRSRPVGISIIAVLLGIQGVFELLFGIIALFAGPRIAIGYGGTITIYNVYPWTFLISGAILLFLVYGLWTLKRWAFWAIVIVEIINLLLGAVQLFTTYNPGAVLLSMVIPAVILIYFLADEHVRTAFAV